MRLCLFLCLFLFFRDRGATLRLVEEGGGTVKDSILGEGGCTRRFFLLTLYSFKNIWGARDPPPPSPPAPRSLFLIRKGEPELRCFRQTKCFEKHRLSIILNLELKKIRGFFQTSDEQCKFIFWHVTAATKHAMGKREDSNYRRAS